MIEKDRYSQKLPTTHTRRLFRLFLSRVCFETHTLTTIYGKKISKSDIDIENINNIANEITMLELLSATSEVILALPAINYVSV